MPCYHPKIGIWTGELTERGKKKIRIISLDKKDTIKDLMKTDSFLIPCGKCIGCRLEYSRKWADRMMLELETAKKGVFVTLTYSNENAHWTQFDDNYNPMFATLDKRDCQLFMKRLRKYFVDVKIRFYLAGEYGDKTLRPHYHAILYGISVDDFPDYQPFGTNDMGQPYYISKILESIWSLGHVLLTDVSWQTCAYVGRYVTKKLSGPMEVSYAERNVCKEFSLMSRKPGIGADYLRIHPDCLDYNSINLTTPEGGLKIMMPKYYIDKLELIDKEKCDKIKEARREFANDKMLLKLRKTDLGLADYLDTCEEKKKADISALKRGKV